MHDVSSQQFPGYLTVLSLYLSIFCVFLLPSISNVCVCKACLKKKTTLFAYVWVWQISIHMCLHACLITQWVETAWSSRSLLTRCQTLWTHHGVREGRKVRSLHFIQWLFILVRNANVKSAAGMLEMQICHISWNAFLFIFDVCHNVRLDTFRGHANCYTFQLLYARIMTARHSA